MADDHKTNVQENEKMVNAALRKWAGLVHLRNSIRAQARGEESLTDKDKRFLNEIERAYRKAYRRMRGACKMGIGLTSNSLDEARYNATRGFDKLDKGTQDVILKHAQLNYKSIHRRFERMEDLKKRAKDVAKKAAIVISGGALVASTLWAGLTFDWQGKEKQAQMPDSRPEVETVVHDEQFDEHRDGGGSEQDVSMEDFIADNKAQSAEQLYNYIDLTSFFEWTTGTVDSRFGNVCPMDKMSAGVVCENPDPFAQTLNTTTKLFIAQAPDEARRILGPYYEQYLQKVRFDAANPTAIFDVNNTDESVAAKERAAAKAFQKWVGDNYDDLEQRIAEMYNHPVGRQIQIKNLNTRLENAEALCDEWGLTTARAQQAVFDMLVLEGKGGARKVYGPSMEATQDLEIEDPSALWDSYFADMYAKKSPDLVGDIQEYYMGLSPEAQLDQYRLNIALDSAVESGVRGPDSTTVRRQSVVLGREFRLNGGILERGGKVNGTFRATNDAVLDSTRTSVPLLIESLASQNYDVSDERLASIIKSQPEFFRFTNQNTVAPPISKLAGSQREN